MRTALRRNGFEPPTCRQVPGLFRVGSAKTSIEPRSIRWIVGSSQTFPQALLGDGKAIEAGA
jgi:hypothetical protein